VVSLYLNPLSMLAQLRVDPCEVETMCTPSAPTSVTSLIETLSKYTTPPLAKGQ
jgi:hypothetical protein